MGQHELAEEFVGSNQTAATKKTFLSAISANPATIRIDNFESSSLLVANQHVVSE